MASIPERAVELKGGAAATIRPARVEDAPCIVALAEASYEDGEGVVRLPEEFRWPVASAAERIAASETDDGRLMLVAESAETVIGLLDFRAGGSVRTRHQGTFGLWVRPGWRGRGLGRALLTRLVEWARTNGIERIGLTVLGDAERAIALYRSLGFREEGRRVREIRYGPGHYADQVQMALFLDA